MCTSLNGSPAMRMLSRCASAFCVRFWAFIIPLNSVFSLGFTLNSLPNVFMLLHSRAQIHALIAVLVPRVDSSSALARSLIRCSADVNTTISVKFVPSFSGLSLYARRTRFSAALLLLQLFFFVFLCTMRKEIF